MKHINFLSFGKDSIAQTILIKQKGYPLDETVFVDIKFDANTSGEHPKMADWIPTAEDILRREFGIKVKHLVAKTTFKDYFYKQKAKGNYIGDIYGFPYTIAAWCNSRLKLDVISQYINSLKDDVTEYVGIAADEPMRYERLITKNTNKITYCSQLFDLGITEKQAFEICRPYNLISPKYDGGSFRSGCWFCVKQCLADLYELWRDYPERFNLLLDMEKDSQCTFNRNYSLPELQARFKGGFVPVRRSKNGK